MLHQFLTEKRDELIARITMRVAARANPPATEEELRQGVPLVFDQLVETLRLTGSAGEHALASASLHGSLLLRMGLSLDQVVHDYVNVRQSVAELALELDASLTVDELQALVRGLDGATARAVAEFGRMRERTITDEGAERIGSLVHELRNRLSTAMLSLGLLRSGKAAINGSVGAMLERSLKGLGELTDRALAEIRLESIPPPRERILMTELIDELEVTGAVDAKARGLKLLVEPVEAAVAIEADREVLAAAIANLLQNALKFTHPTGTVRLATHATADRVLIDIEDECGGLPDGKTDGLFRPFEQCGADRSGLGLGLSISRRGVHANGGEIHVRNLPGKGCVFTVDLPRVRGLRLILGELAAVAPPILSDHGDAG